MKTATPILALTILLLSPSRDAAAAFDPQDPLEGNRPLARSSEILALRADPVLTPRLYDANGDVAEGGMSGPNVLTPPTGYRGVGYDFDGVAADFDGDGKQEFAYAYEATDGYAYIRVADADDGSLGTVSGCCVRAEKPMQGALRRRPMRLVAGQADADPAPELILAYRAGSGFGAEIAIEYFDVDPVTLVPTRTQTTARPAFTTAPNGCPAFDPVFDVAFADADADGTDELVVALTARACTAPGAARNDHIDVAIRTAAGWLPGTNGQNATLHPIMTTYGTENLWHAVALAVGNFDRNAPAAQGPGEEIAVVSQYKSIVDGKRRMFGSLVRVDATGTVATVGPTYQSLAANAISGTDTRLDADAADLDSNGFPELVTADGTWVQIAEIDPDTLTWSVGSSRAVVGSSTGLNVQETGLGRLLVGDLDASASTTFVPEIGVANAWDLTIDVFRPTRNALGAWDLLLIATPPLANEHNSDVTLFPIDVDDDGIRLGAAQAQRRDDVFQPIVLLNAPPVHFDVLGGQVHDINGCWDPDECEHTATYTNGSSMEGAVTTEVRSSWAVSRELRAGVSAEFGFVSASVEAHLGNEVGQDLANLGAQTQTFSESFSLTAMSDDWLYGTKLDYWVVEYPIFAQGGSEPITDVVVVVPIYDTPAWVKQRSALDVGVLQDHEHGNLLSYWKRYGAGNPLEEVSLPYTTASSQVAITTDTNATWDVFFEQGQESEWSQASRQSVSAGLDLELSASAFGISGSLGATVEGSYGSEAIRTHTNTATTFGSLQLSLSDHEGIGGDTYADYLVTPYLYWSYAGALVVDYEVEFPQATAQVPTFWNDEYGQLPDLAMSMPWRHDMEKYGQTVGELPERTRDIVLTVLDEDPLDVMISARVQNYSFVPSAGGTLHFYRGHPDEGGEWIGMQTIDPIAPREDVLVELSGWTPASLDAFEPIYVEIVPFDADQIHTGNDLAWNYAAIHLPEPGSAMGLGSGVLLLQLLVRRRRQLRPTRTRTWRTRAGSTSRPTPG